MTQVAIVNQSSIVSDTDGNTITSALNKILPSFCKDWSLSPHSCVYVGKGKTTTILLKIFLKDTADESGSLAYHDEINDIPYGKAFAKTVLSYGGVMLYSQDPNVPTFAQAVCHELFEMLIDPNCNVWTMLSDYSTLYAYEVCDAVQSNPVTVLVQTGSSTSKIYLGNSKIVLKTVTNPIYSKVGVSDWVLPSWFDPQKKRGPYNHNNTLKAPFTLDKGGYVISLTNGHSNIVWGENVAPERQKVIAGKLRLSRRAK